jgi:hypothetical protein
MGQDWRPNETMSVELILAVLEESESRISDAPTYRETNRWTVFHTFAVVAYVISLRGSEGFLLDIGGLRRHRQLATSDHCVIALLGKIKGENHNLAHLIPCVKTTSSGIRVQASLDRLLDLKEAQGLRDGPAISDMGGRLYQTRGIDDCFQEILEDLFQAKHHLFPTHIIDSSILRQKYQVFRTYHKLSDSRAMAMGASDGDIDVVNRWKTIEGAKGTRPNRPMRQHYTLRCTFSNPLPCGTPAPCEEKFAQGSLFMIRIVACSSLLQCCV